MTVNVGESFHLDPCYGHEGQGVQDGHRDSADDFRDLMCDCPSFF
jgi:hypothetical protein